MAERFVCTGPERLEVYHLTWGPVRRVATLGLVGGMLVVGWVVNPVGGLLLTGVFAMPLFMRPSQTFEFDSETFAVRGYPGRVKWKQVARWAEGPLAFHIFFGPENVTTWQMANQDIMTSLLKQPAHGFTVPKRVLEAEEQDRLRGLLSTR